MYLAPLNYDRFFKKVFSDLEIAKAFIEDFLDVEIEMIESLDTAQRFTDSSAIVEFDYRCRINGHYIIIDMQQWYKPDVVQRFFLYHSLNTGLQLEGLPVKTIGLDRVTKESKKIKDYRLVEPVFTLIWMVHDKLGFEDNFISYKLYPSTVEEFLKDNTLWKNREIQKIVEERENVLKQITNDTKELDFLPKNSLTFMFQQNIIKDTRLSKYINWFRFAEKTRNENNRKEDFEEFRGDEIFERAIKRINVSDFSEDETQYLIDETERQLEIDRWTNGIFEDGRKEERKKQELLREQERKEQELLREQERKEQELLREQERKEQILSLHKFGMSPDKIAEVMSLSEKDVKAVVDNQ